MEKCSGKLFGYNFECTRRFGYSGIYAEMIDDSRLLYTDRSFYHAAFDGMTGLGQCTERMHFLTDRSYAWHIVADGKISVRFLTEYGRALHSSNEPRGVFDNKFDSAYSRMEVVSEGKIRYISLKPADALYECRRDVLDAIKEMHPQTIRFPGGCFAEKYKWKDGLLPIEDRPPISDEGKFNLFCSHYRYDGYELNIDDYIAICRYVGAEPEWTVKLTKNDPQDAADLVEYCNGDASTKYGALRISRGYKEPYNIRTWYIGNEVGYITSPETAAELHDQFVAAMLCVDPTIKTVATTGNIADWDKRFLAHAKTVDCCAQHSYIENNIPGYDLQQLLDAAEGPLYRKLEAACERLDGRRMLFDEWNLRWGTMGDSDSGLYAAGVMTMLIRNQEKLNLDGASYFALVNEGIIRVYQDVTSDDMDFTNRLAGILYGGREKTGGDCGKIPMWSWAASRVMDYCQTLECLDFTKSAVVGHSRLGKTALYTGMMDTRFQFAISNDSGFAGAALNRNREDRERGEPFCSVAFCVEHHMQWFSENYRKYADREETMPYDQHFLVAATAPRHVYVASAEEDYWSDPKTEYLSCCAAGAVYEQLGITGFVHPDRYPNPGEHFHDGHVGYHIRHGVHYFSREDWNMYCQYIKNNE